MVKIGPPDHDCEPVNFREAVQRLVDITSSLPPGWQQVYGEAMKRLKQLDAPHRTDMFIHGPLEDGGKIRFELSRTDAAVEGLLRKASARLNATCWICAGQAKRRRLGLRMMPLCAGCYAPRALRSELTRLLRELAVKPATEQRQIHAAQDLSPRIRALIPPEKWRRLRSERGNEAVRFLTEDDLKGFSGSLEALRDHLALITGHAVQV
jgi:hypothetical protein